MNENTTRGISWNMEISYSDVSHARANCTLYNSLLHVLPLTNNPVIMKGGGAGCSLISSLKTHRRTLYITHWSLDLFIRVSCQLHGAISTHLTYRTHCHLCPTGYSLTPESIDCMWGWSAQHRGNVPTLKGEKHNIYVKILHQALFELWIWTCV